MADSEIKPCPRCGTAEFLEVVEACEGCLYAVKCKQCGMRGSSRFKKNNGHITAWNRAIAAVHGGKSDE